MGGGRLNMAVLVIETMEIAEPMIGAMRGRNPDNPSERAKSNGKYKQRLEMNENGTSNTITSVQKDNLVVEPMCSVHPLSHKFEFDPETSIKPLSPALRATDYKAPHCVYEPKIRQVGRGFNKGGEHDICPTITSNSFECNNFVLGSMQKNAYKGTTDGVSPAITAACGMGGGQTPMIGNNYRIRKLTPRECFRLMGVEDTDIDKLMSAGISNSQLYKCAGNSIVVDTLYHLFRKLFCDKESEEATKYNIGDEVWWYWLGSIVPANGVILGYRKMGKLIFAAIRTSDGVVYIEEYRLFPTKEELLKSL